MEGLQKAGLKALVERGLSIRAMAEELGCSPTTVRYWLGRHGLRTAEAARRAERRSANAGIEGAVRECPTHGRVRHIRRGSGFRCGRCSAEAVTAWRRRLKETLVAEAGGACALCGYARCLGALQFHHVDPTTKRMTISRRGMTRSVAEARAEAAKCVLLCANCHAEVENGAADLSLRSAAAPPSGGRFPG